MSSDRSAEGALLAPGAVAIHRLSKHYAAAHVGKNIGPALPWTTDLVGPNPVIALDAVSFTIEPGEAVGIIGPNGAGKSTLLKILAGVVAPTAGNARHGGRIGQMIELGVGFHQELTGRENLLCTAALMGLGIEEAHAILPEVIEFADIGEALDTPLKRYSTGMRARLGFALASQIPADILLVDEALAVGDPDFQMQSAERIMTRVKEGSTLVYVSHDLRGLALLCNRVLHIHDGALIDDGPAQEVIERYLITSPSDFRRPPDPQARIVSLTASPASPEPGDPAVLVAEIEVTEPIRHGDLLVEVSLPTYAPDVPFGRCLASVPGRSLVPGRYLLEGVSSPIPVRGDVRFRLFLSDAGQRQLLDSADVDLRFGQVIDISGKPSFSNKPSWTMARAEAPSWSQGMEVRAPAPVDDDQVVVRTHGLHKRYASGRRRSNLALARPGPYRPRNELDVVALDDVSIEIRKGESVGITGPNGAGKSTLLKVLANVVAPTSGSFEVTGRAVSILELGVGFHQEYTGAENVAQAAAFLGLTEEELDERWPAILEFSGLADAMDRPVKRYSTGMKARLGFALAAQAEADVLLIDEVLAVGDHEFRQQVAELMRKLLASGVALVFVSHNMRLVQELCDRTIRLEHGRVVDDGPTEEVIERHGGLGWAGGSSSGTMNLKLHQLELEPRNLRPGDPISFRGWVEVTAPCPTVRLEVTYRAAVRDREAIISPERIEMMTLMSVTVEPPGHALAEPGWYHFEGTIEGNHLNGAIDVVVAAVDTTDGERVAEAWQTMHVGDIEHRQLGNIEPNEMVSLDFDLEWRTLGDAGPLPS